MKNKSLKFFDKFVMALLGLFPFFSGCDEPREMYGTPTADYLIKGTVSDELTSNPVKDIRVIIRDSRDSLYWMADTLYTDSDGKYAFAFRNVPDNEIIYELKAEDLDGANNGGPFTTAETTASIADATWDRSKADGWYTGKATIIKDINLLK